MKTRSAPGDTLPRSALGCNLLLVLNCRIISFLSVRRTGCLEGSGCASSGLPLERSILPRFPMGACDVAGCGCWLGTCCRAGFLCTCRGVSSDSLSTCSASPCSGLGDARLLLTPLFFFLFCARAGVVELLVPRRVPSFGAVVALETCARLLTPSLPLIPIPTMSVAPVAYRSSCDRKPGISGALVRRSA
jgi:hypothetical protein